MRNNNGGVVRKLVWNNLRQHGLQYRFVFLAIIISSMLRMYHALSQMVHSMLTEAARPRA